MSAGSPIAIEAPAPARRAAVWWFAPVAVVAVALGSWLLLGRGEGGGGLVTGQYYTAVPMDLEVKIVKDGELQAVNNTDIICQVEGITAIQSLVKEGTFAQKGDVLIQLDSSSIKEKLEDTVLRVQKAEADLTTAREMRDIQKSQNEANLEAAQVGMALAKLDLQQYTDGTYPQQLENARTALKMAELNLKNKEENLAQTRALFGKGFVTAADVKKDEMDFTTTQNDVQKAKTALTVLETYTHQMDMAKLNSTTVQTEQRLVRVQKENAANLAQRNADVQAAQEGLSLLQRRLSRLQEQLENCTIKAPEGGLVIYASSIDRSMRDPIQEGGNVREKQLLLRLPDVRTMKAVIKIQESQVPRLNAAANPRATVKVVGVPHLLGATLSKVSPLPDNSQRWWNPDLKEYPVELTLDATPPGLKPGVGVQAEIFVDRFEQAVAVPVACIYSAGQESYVFVRQGDRPMPQKVKVGPSNETHVQIAEGLNGGEDVLLLQPNQGRVLLEQAGIKAAPTSRPSAAGGDGKGRRAGGTGGGRRQG